MKFQDFNRAVNPDDEQCYVAVTLGKSPKAATFKEIMAIAKTDNTLEIGWVIPKGFYVIETTQKSILPLIIAQDENVMVVSTPTTLRIFCKGDFGRTTINNVLACGIPANTIAHNKSGDTVLLHYKAPGNISPRLAELSFEYSNGIGLTPKWLLPLRKISSSVVDGLELPITSNVQPTLLNILKKIKHMNRMDQIEIVKLVNENFCSPSLSDEEMDGIFSTSEDAFVAQFFDHEKFLHNKLGDYVIRSCNIKRDRESKDLYYYNEVEKIYAPDQDYVMSYITRLCPTLKQFQKDEVVKYMNSCLYDESVVFNADPLTVVFKNGILDVRTLKFEPMDPSRLETIKINANYDREAVSPTVDEFFATATAGDKDIETLLYEAIGYAMLKTNELQKSFIAVGSGRNGKSTYEALLRQILGKENVVSISFKDLSNTFRAASLVNKLASIAGDISAQPITDSDLVKSIIAGEEITMEQKYKNPTSKGVFATLFFACNKLPRTPDTTEGFYRRWTIIPFIADLSKITRTKGMEFKEKLLAQNSLDYTAYKAVHAIHRVLYTTEDFTEPTAVKDMMRQYKIDNSTILSWFHEVHEAKTATIEKQTAQDAYLSYANWCSTSGRMKSSMTNFIQSVRVDIGVEFKKR